MKMLTFLLFLCGWFSLACAYDQSLTVNLGSTSFLDGGVPNGPGWYWENYTQFYHTHKFTDNEGHKLPLPKQSFNAIANILQLIYISQEKICGVHWGFDVLLPMLIKKDIDDGLHHRVLDATTGVGDLLIGPILQFDPIMSEEGEKGRPLFVQRFEFDFFLPVGKYRRHIPITPGANFWSFNPYWAATVWPHAKWEISWRLHYLWNAKNHDPKIGFGPDVSWTQAGQVVHANIASSVEVLKKLRLGINGYFFIQFTDTKADGHHLKGRRERVWAIGPGLMYSFSLNNILLVNLYFEQHARNRPQGTSLFLRYVYHF